MLDQRTGPYGVLLLRLTLGAFFWAHIYLKFFLYPGGFHQWWDNFAITDITGSFPGMPYPRRWLAHF
jgi:putative oxidoreductase